MCKFPWKNVQFNEMIYANYLYPDFIKIDSYIFIMVNYNQYINKRNFFSLQKRIYNYI